MRKLEQIKLKLAKILLQFTSVKTDKGILEFDGEELAIDAEVFIVDENGERSKPEDGEYLTEDDKVIVVADGKVTEIKEKEEPIEEPTEEVVEEMEGEEPVTEEPIEEPTNDVEERLSALETKIEELFVMVEQILSKMNADTEQVEERLSKIEKMSASKTIEEEIELSKKFNKTGNAKVDRFIERYGK